jgi:hypothetical protein
VSKKVLQKMAGRCCRDHPLPLLADYPMFKKLFKLGLALPRADVVSHLRHIRNGDQAIYLDYPFKPKPRYGWGSKPHQEILQIVEANRRVYLDFIDRFRSFVAGLKNIPVEKPEDVHSPYWMNGFVQGLDAVSLYAFPSLFNSQLYIEIGSGNSTKFVKKAITDGASKSRIISIDPNPRAEIDSLCHEVIRERLEDISLDIFDQLAENDILMIDNSHRCFQNSDVTVVFLDILPRLKRGVLIYIDDIYLPNDYPMEWNNRYYSEQYLLAVLLMADRQRRYEILFPAHFITFIDKQLSKSANDFWNSLGLQHATGSNGFWMRVVGT